MVHFGFNQKSVPDWTLEAGEGDPPSRPNTYKNPLAQITLQVPGAPYADASHPLTEGYQVFVAKAKEAGATTKLINRPGKVHGWPEMLNDFQLLADWFDQHLRGMKPNP